MRSLRLRHRWKALSDIQHDLVLGGGGAAVALAAMLLEGSEESTLAAQAPLVLGVALTLASGGALALCKDRPLAGGVISAGAYTLVAGLEYPVWISGWVSMLIVGICAAHATRRATVALGAVVVALALALELYEGLATVGGELAPSALAGSIALAVVPVAIGDAFRVRRELATEARMRVARLEQLRELELTRALDAERLRIARDVHDTVGHHLSAIAIQAGAAEQLTQEGELPGALRALATIRDLTGTALSETRRLLGMVRTEAERRAPGLAGSVEIEALVRHAKRGNLEVVVRRLGQERPLDGVIGDCAYRIVQEALTNICRHAAAKQALIELRYGPSELELVIEDDGCGGAAAFEGHGLIGMRERVAISRGQFSAGPLPGRGWRVCATLPYEPLTTR